MEYIAQLNAFYHWLDTNPIGPSARLLWYCLMQIANASGWRKELTIPMQLLEHKTGLSRRTLYRARNQLVQAGRLGCRSRAGNQSAVYTLYPLERPGDTHCGRQSGTEDDTQHGTQCVTISRQEKIRQDEDPAARGRQADHQPGNGSGPLRDAQYARAAAEYQRNFALQPMGIIADVLDQCLKQTCVEAVIYAIEAAKAAHARIPHRYLERVVAAMAAAGVRDKAGVEAYRRRAGKGRPTEEPDYDEGEDFFA